MVNLHLKREGNNDVKLHALTTLCSFTLYISITNTTVNLKMPGLFKIYLFTDNRPTYL